MNNMNDCPKKWLITILVLFAEYVTGQTVLSGRVTDQYGQPVAFANIVLRSGSTAKTLAYCFSDSSGYFNLKTDIPRGSWITFSAMACRTKKLDLPPGEPAAALVRHIVMESEAQVLNEVIVTATPPILIRNDTIIADANSFANGKERVLEDLLKKIPGVQVLEDGTVKVGNREVEKIMIEGDDFFEKSYRLLTRNMPPHPVGKVEIVQHYSANRLMKGIVKSDKVALNLKMKPGVAHKWFGNLEAGIDCVAGKYYDGKINLVKLGKRLRQYWLGSMNNIGVNQPLQANEAEHKVAENVEDDLAGTFPGAVQLINTNAVAMPGNKKSPGNNSGLYALNAIWRPADNISIKTGLQLCGEQNRFYSTTIDSAGINQLSFVNRETMNMYRNGLNGSGKINLKYDWSENSILEYEMKTGLGNIVNRNHLLFNQQTIRDTLQTNTLTTRQLLRLSCKLSGRSFWQIAVQFISDEAPQQYHVDEFNYQQLFPNAGNADQVYQSAGHQMQMLSVQSKLSVRRSAKSFVDLLVGMSYRKDALSSELSLVQQSIPLEHPEGFQNNLNTSVRDLFLKARHRYQLGKITLIQQLEIHALGNIYRDGIRENKQQVQFINPLLGMEWKCSEKNLLLLNCGLTKRNSQVNEIFGNYLLNGYRFFTRGAAGFDQPAASLLSLSFTHGNWADRFFANVILLYNTDLVAYGTRSTIAQSYMLQEAILTNNNRMATLTSNLDYYLSAIAANLKLTFNTALTGFTNEVNGSGLRNIRHSFFNGGLEIRSAWKKWFNVHAGTAQAYHRIMASANSHYADFTSFLDLHFKCNKYLQLNLKTESFRLAGADQLSSSYYFFDLDLRYSPVNNKLEFTIAGRNLLNTRQFRNYRFTDLGYTSTIYRLLPGYLLLSASLKL
ncbi:MAG TPA: hypothetical protein VJ552_13285 [Sediminibacterium sp.]|nr:hypothetical protein [Sediminibacterium sp.]